jgi:N-acetylglucosamine-6-phosphate deacetylase
MTRPAAAAGGPAHVVFSGGRVLTPDTEADWLTVSAGRIDAVGHGEPPAAAETVDLAGRLLAPGFIDLHVHGGGGASFMSGDPEECARAAAFHAAHGTTALLATTLTAPPGDLLRAVAAVAETGILGVHLEGPYLNERRRGAQAAEHLRPPDLGELAALLAAGPVRMVSLAPELPGALEAVVAIDAAGAVPALAHTDATYGQALAAIEAGARHAVHTFNGMRPLHHREPGVAGAVLEDARVTCEAIADGHHLHPAALRLVHRAKGAGGMALITDAIPATGLGDGEHRLGDVPIRVAAGRAETAEGSLAGSTLTMDAAVRNAHAWGLPLTDALIAAATTPAWVLGVPKGRLAPGYDADLVILDAGLRPAATYLAGRLVSAGSS